MSGFSARLAVNLKKELETWPGSFAYVYSAKPAILSVWPITEENVLTPALQLRCSVWSTLWSEHLKYSESELRL